eukprot:TRINITY_DN5791_c0_g1_i1.p1 TRINITY_DN5791_c0_g1~~TRINITY_DN5791_c0_g1_i1.p1  ORF type:complete len:579 (+),score=111.77 TRINITY_DN5791_c0_g1_i1:183-1919(+)
MYFVVAAVTFVWVAVNARRLQEDVGSVRHIGFVVNEAALATYLTVSASVLVYMQKTRRVSAALCENSMVVLAVAVLVNDTAMVLLGHSSLIALNIIVLDTMLLCDCSAFATKMVVAMTILWIVGRAFLEREDFRDEEPARFSSSYFLRAGYSVTTNGLVLLVDFWCTRGFASSMHEQRASIEAAIQLTEAAAVRLSRYETAETRELLGGPDGARLPEGLRAALLQLVQNLAIYRPYLPQSCLGGDDVGSSDRTAPSVSSEEEESVGVVQAVRDRVSTRSRRWTDQRSASQLSGSDKVEPRKNVAGDVKPRRVSLLAVNSKSFLRTVQMHQQAVQTAVNSAVEAFVGEVAVERGVVDTVCGDHMFANFNASKLCTGHRSNACRVAWNMLKARSRQGARTDAAQRSAAVCSGSMLCGDLGTSDVRRFMLIGPAFNTLQCLERVAATLGGVLVDEIVGADSDVGSTFFSVLVERLVYRKRGAKPFLVWQLSDRRAAGSGPDEWMYELERQVPNPYEEWNKSLEQWLKFLTSVDAPQVAPAFADRLAVTGQREQALLVEAAVVGSTVLVGADQSLVVDEHLS